MLRSGNHHCVSLCCGINVWFGVLVLYVLRFPTFGHCLFCVSVFWLLVCLCFIVLVIDVFCVFLCLVIGVVCVFLFWLLVCLCFLVLVIGVSVFSRFGYWCVCVFSFWLLMLLCFLCLVIGVFVFVVTFGYW